MDRESRSTIYEFTAMSRRDGSRIVYSTDAGRICAGCGWPSRDCKCSKNTGSETVPVRVIAKLRVEKAGRAGKTVTVVYDLPRNAAFLKQLCADLKRACGTGGAVSDNTVELQGELRDRVRDLLLQRGFGVKG
jgi:translation initiation factor 1